MRHYLPCALISLASMLAAGCSAETQDKISDARESSQEAASSAAKDMLKAAEGLLKDGTEVREKLSSALENLTTTLKNIRDSETAQAALTKLRESEQTLGELVRSLEQLPAAAKPVIAAMAQRGSTKLRELIQQVQQNQQLAEPLQPVLDRILEHLNKVEMVEKAELEPSQRE